tara:strand:+ start:167 stop:343 length:177 start_codon:yes stop_codon:yes gene_type:complete
MRFHIFFPTPWIGFENIPGVCGHCIIIIVHYVALLILNVNEKDGFFGILLEIIFLASV